MDEEKLLSLLGLPIQHALDGQETLRRTIDEHTKQIATQQVQIQNMGEEMDELKKEIREAKDSIIANQQEKFAVQEKALQQTISLQRSIAGALGLALAGAAISYFFPGVVAFLLHFIGR